jgi:hypothetical protein
MCIKLSKYSSVVLEDFFYFCIAEKERIYLWNGKKEAAQKGAK